MVKVKEVLYTVHECRTFLLLGTQSEHILEAMAVTKVLEQNDQFYFLGRYFSRLFLCDFRVTSLLSSNLVRLSFFLSFFDLSRDMVNETMELLLDKKVWVSLCKLSKKSLQIPKYCFIKMAVDSLPS